MTTTTISREQHALARERVREAGLEDRVTVLLQDYRDAARARYDKLVSIEMIEAVGWQYFHTLLPPLLASCSRDDGAMLLQAITIDDRAYDVEKAGRSFINTLHLPRRLPARRCESSRARSPARPTCARCTWRTSRAHYATTLAHWRERFLASAERAWRELGYDERFRRLWELYLSYCEGGFRERRIQDVQLLLAKPGYRAGARSPVSLLACGARGRR